jgi:hypothetical protein
METLVRFKLQENPNVPYSAGEKQVVTLLNDGPLDTNALVDAYYKNLRRKKPHFARESLTSTINGLNRKLEANKEAFLIQKGDRGPWPMSFKLASTKGNKS